MATEDGHATKPGEDPPPKYISSLIGSINDAAKSAQTSALFLGFLGLYLAATAISISDVDLLRGATIQVSQLGGVNIPIIATFLLGPIVFLVLHAQLLIRYRKLVIAVRLFSGQLKKVITDETDRARCRELLANMDLVLMVAGRDDPSTNTWIYRWAVFVGVALVPVAVLLVVQISFLRYQSVGITLAQRVALIVDLGMVVFFYYWLWSSGRESVPSIGQRIRVLTAYAVAPLGLIALNFCYLNVPAAESRTVRIYEYPEECRDWRDWWRQPLDLLVCPELNWGCRYLNLSSRVLVVDKPGDEAARTLRLGEGDVDDALDSIIGVSASNRNLRFANFNQSQAYRINLSSSDLRGATFWKASLQGAKLAYADLRGTNLEFAHLQNADLYSANLAKLLPAGRSNDDSVPLQTRDSCDSRLTGFQNTNLFAAYLGGAKLQGAKLWDANLAVAQLEGANLFQAHLQRAILDRAKLAIADLREAKVYKTSWTKVDPDLADISDVDACSTPEEETKLAKELKEAPDGEAKNRIDRRAKDDLIMRRNSGGCSVSGDLKNILNNRLPGDEFAKELCRRYLSNFATATIIAKRIVDIRLSNSEKKADTDATDLYRKVACCLGKLPPDRKPKIHRDLEDKLAVVIADGECAWPSLHKPR